MSADERSPEVRARRDAIFLLGYGSLTSGLGLCGLRPLPARRLERVRLLNCRRGFGKPSQYGDRLAMVLEPLRDDEPIRAEPLGSAPAQAAVSPEALLLALSMEDLTRVARREGYRPEALLSLDEQARSEGTTLPEYLWNVLASISFDRGAYRRELVCRVGYTSPHYVPHPVPVGDGAVAITFLAPGVEGSGAPDIVPMRVAAGSTAVLSMVAAWRAKRNASQLEYFLMCLLGAVHNLSLADVFDGMEEEAELRRRLADLAAPEMEAEPERFRDALCLSREDYDHRFGRGPHRPSLLAALLPAA
jgi:hypothetical protein